MFSTVCSLIITNVPVDTTFLLKFLRFYFSIVKQSSMYIYLGPSNRPVPRFAITVTHTTQAKARSSPPTTRPCEIYILPAAPMNVPTPPVPLPLLLVWFEISASIAVAFCIVPFAYKVGSPLKLLGAPVLPATQLLYFFVPLSPNAWLAASVQIVVMSRMCFG